MNFVGTGSGKDIRGFNATEDFSLSVTPYVYSHGSGGTPIVTLDMNILSQSGVLVDYIYTVNYGDSLVYPGTVLTNVTPGIATFSVGSPATYVSNGTAVIQATNSVLGMRSFSIPVWRNASGSVTSFVDYVHTSVAYTITNQIDSLILGKTPANSGITPSSANQMVFSATDWATAATRNTNLWCKTIVDLSGVGAWEVHPTRGSRHNFPPNLISPRHFAVAGHVSTYCQPGTVCTFVGSDNTIHSATVVDISYLHGFSHGDIHIGIFDVEIPAICKPFSVFPASASPYISPGYLPSLNLAYNGLAPSGYTKLPIMHLDQNQIIWLLDWNGITGATPQEINYPACNESNRVAWTNGVYGGDSGSPAYTVLPGSTTPILLGCCHTTGTAVYPSALITEINAMMTVLTNANGGGTNYQLTQVDLSGYPTY